MIFVEGLCRKCTIPSTENILFTSSEESEKNEENEDIEGEFVLLI